MLDIFLSFFLFTFSFIVLAFTLSIYCWLVCFLGSTPVTRPYVCVLTFDCPNGSVHVGNSIKATLACRCCET